MMWAMWVWVSGFGVSFGILLIVMMLLGVCSFVESVEVSSLAGGVELYDLVRSASIEELRVVGLGLGKREVMLWVLSSTVYVSVRSISIEELEESEVLSSLEGINL